MIYMSAMLAFLDEEYCHDSPVAEVHGGVTFLTDKDGWAEVWRDVTLAYRDAKRDYGTANGIRAAIEELAPNVRGTAAELLAGDLLKDEPVPNDLHEVAETWSGEGLAARVWLYWVEHDGCDGWDVCEGLEVL